MEDTASFNAMPDRTKGWTRTGGDFSILGGSSLISDCEPHFHETYVIAFMRKGESKLRFRDHATVWQSGGIFLCNPYELVSGQSAAGELAYDVCYPSRTFMREALGWTGARGESFPRLSAEMLSVDDIAELAAILKDFTTLDEQPRSCSTTEQRLLNFIRDRRTMIVDEVTRTDVAWITRVHDEVDGALNGHVGISELADRLRCDRSHFLRVIRRATGLPPSSYIRQLRLARALESIRDGMPLADTAAIFGFSDQAHLTREFKRIYGTTPGKLARDITH